MSSTQSPIDIEQIKLHFLLFANLPSDDATKAKWESICEVGKFQIISKLKSPVITDAEKPLAELAAAGIINYLYSLTIASGNAEFSAGDIAIKDNSDKIINSAYKLMNSLLSSISFMLEDTNFVFTSVKW